MSYSFNLTAPPILGPGTTVALWDPDDLTVHPHLAAHQWLHQWRQYRSLTGTLTTDQAVTLLIEERVVTLEPTDAGPWRIHSAWRVANGGGAGEVLAPGVHELDVALNGSRTRVRIRVGSAPEVTSTCVLHASGSTEATIVGASDPHTHGIADVTGLQAALDAAGGGPHVHELDDVDGLDDALAGRVLTDDPRLSDARTPTAHAHPQGEVTGLVATLAAKADASHAHGQGDVTGLAAALAAKEDAGVAATAVAAHAAASDPHPTYTTAAEAASAASSAVSTHVGLGDPHPAYQLEAEKNQANGYAGLDGSGKVPGTRQTYGSAADTACQGNDARLSDARAPTAHTQATSTVTFAATDRLLGRSTAGAGAGEEVACTAAGRALLDDADAAAQRSTLGLGALATKAAVATADITDGVVTYAKLQDLASTQRVLGRNTAGAGDAEEVTAAQLLDWLGATRGSVLVRGASGWTILPPGTSGHVLTSLGAGADPTYQAAPGGGGATDKDDQYYRQVGTSPLERWYVGGQGNATALTTGAPTVGVLRALPFVSTRGGTLDRIAVQVTTLIASGVGRCGIYAATSDVNLYPNARILDAGEILTSTTGLKAATINQVLTANTLYWLVYLAGTAAATIRCLAVAGCSALLGLDNALGAAPAIGIQVNQAYGALPATFPAGGSVITAVPIPAIGVRFSA